jgi:hypothetical protein
MTLYWEEFLTVIQLEVNMRLDENDPNAVEFEAFLNRLADGKCTVVVVILLVSWSGSHGVSMEMILPICFAPTMKCRRRIKNV